MTKKEKIDELETDNVTKFLILLDQKLNTIPNVISANDLVCQTNQSFIQTANEFAHEKRKFFRSNSKWMNTQPN